MWGRETPGEERTGSEHWSWGRWFLLSHTLPLLVACGRAAQASREVVKGTGEWTEAAQLQEDHTAVSHPALL